MKLPTFIYLALSIILLQILSLDYIQVKYVVYSIFTVGILTVGVGHGAVDDVLHQKGNKNFSRLSFVLRYIAFIVLYSISWILLPNLALLGFLLISGYHFGQAQFIEYKLVKSPINKILYLSWGTMIIFLILFLNSDSLLAVNKSYSYVPGLLNEIILHAGLITLSSALLVVTILLYKVFRQEITFEDLASEFLLLLLMAISFFLFDAFISFAIFFLVIHSFVALRHEFSYFKHQLDKNFIFFVKSILPFTIISVIGLCVILFITYQFGYQDYVPLILLILVSSITAPHSFVMNEFYSNTLDLRGSK